MTKTFPTLTLLACCLALYSTDLLSSKHAHARTHQIMTAMDNPAAATYNSNCASCHQRGVMGAPKPGDSRFLADIDMLVENAIKGIGNMPARGHAAFLSDDEIRAVVEFMRSPN
ncbi:MAG: c-type cytochrome [Desulfuromonadales bacterium]|nr:c-type cytochrome [Desulfuromonadales bacterium]